MRIERLSFLLAVSMMGLFLAACERIKINEINADPGRFLNKEVSVVGKVTQSIGALGTGVYQIDDGTGTLWVFAEKRSVPSKGALVGVKGHVTPTVTFLGKNYATVLRETNRHAG